MVAGDQAAASVATESVGEDAPKYAFCVKMRGLPWSADAAGIVVFFEG